MASKYRITCIIFPCFWVCFVTYYQTKCRNWTKNTDAHISIMVPKMSVPLQYPNEYIYRVHLKYKKVCSEEVDFQDIVSSNIPQFGTLGDKEYRCAVYS